MVYWNKPAKEILEKIKDKILSKQIKNGFFIINGPANIGKKTLVFDIINKIWVLPQDKLILEDPWKEDGKLYQIKVDEDLDILEINNKKFYTIWARQIAEFISKTPIGEYKVVFIENLERLNIASANALLKIFEEMPENVFIFATTSNKNKILTTILSRAILVNMYPLSLEDFNRFLEDNLISLDEHKKHLLFAVSWARIWLARRLLEENNDLLDKIEEYLELEKLSSTWWKFSLIKDLIQENKINLFIDGLIFYYSHTNEFEKVARLTEIKKKNQANVNLENLLFSYLIS
jgi:DNA polymerase III delta prime subunit